MLSERLPTKFHTGSVRIRETRDDAEQIRAGGELKPITWMQRKE